MSWLGVVLFFYALLNIGGGIEGYMAKGSIASLISGVASGLILIGAATLAKSNPKIGYGIAAFVTVATAGFFISRYVKSHAVWPALVMIVASVLVLVCLIVGHFMAGSKPATG